MLGFIDHDGDLRKCGVFKGETVAFFAPPGSRGVVAFLACMAQTNVLPLDPRMNIDNKLRKKLKLAKVKHFLIFPSIPMKDSKKKAFENLCEDACIHVHNVVESET